VAGDCGCGIISGARHLALGYLQTRYSAYGPLPGVCWGRCAGANISGKPWRNDGIWTVGCDVSQEAKICNEEVQGISKLVVNMLDLEVVGPAGLSEWSDKEIIERVLAGDTPAYELLMRRYNQRLYRLVRSILRDEAEAEDVMQEAYVRAFYHLAQYEGRSSFSTWIGHIAVNEALARISKAKRLEYTDFSNPAEMVEAVDPSMNPEENSALQEAQNLLERAILELPDIYRTVVMMHDVEEMTTEETAALLEITEQSVRVRLHRGRALTRKRLFVIAGTTSTAAFQFHAPRCNRLVKKVLERIFVG
jgi:RNA polymerase sigma-70 factor (ECF subfamily)